MLLYNVINLNLKLYYLIINPYVHHLNSIFTLHLILLMIFNLNIKDNLINYFLIQKHYFIIMLKKHLKILILQFQIPLFLLILKQFLLI